MCTNDRLSLRAFSDASGAMWKTSVKDIAGEVLCVSQFTLLANTTKGSKPDFHRAMVRSQLIVASRQRVWIWIVRGIVV